MSDIKFVIQILCQQLNILLNTNLKPENFRMAKFNYNDIDTIKELWESLWKLSKALGAVFPEEHDYGANFLTQMYMASKSYNCVEFYCLPWDNSSGSRELLLAFIWLIASENALSELTLKYVGMSPLSQEYPDSSKEQVLKCMQNLKLLPNEAKEKLNLENQLDYCLWLANRIKFNLNGIREAEQARVSKTTKIHEATRGASGLPHLSVYETKLVYDSEFLKDNMSQLLHLSELLEVHTKWMKKRSVFWEWMDSVIELKEKDVNDATCLDSNRKACFENFLESFESFTNIKKSGDTATSLSNSPRFFLSCSISKPVSPNGNGLEASDWITQLDTALQDAEQLKIQKCNQLNGILHTLSQKLGLVVVGENGNSETESEDCSK